jgi:hypothetical protein
MLVNAKVGRRQKSRTASAIAAIHMHRAGLSMMSGAEIEIVVWYGADATNLKCNRATSVQQLETPQVGADLNCT